MTDIDPMSNDGLNLSIHEAAWEIVEQIKDRYRTKIRVHVYVDEDGMLILRLPDMVTPGEYDITVLIETPEEEPPA